MPDYRECLAIARQAARQAGARGDDVEEAAARAMLHLQMAVSATGKVPEAGWVARVAQRRAVDLARERFRRPTVPLGWIRNSSLDSHEQDIVAAEEAQWLLDQINRLVATSMSDEEVAAMGRLLAFDRQADRGEVTVRSMLRAVVEVRPDLFDRLDNWPGDDEAPGVHDGAAREREVERTARNLQRPLARIRARYGRR